MDRLAKILTIEDITLSTECIGTCFLRDSRYDTLQAHNGIDGLALFQREHPDVVLCDLHLLGTEGLDVLAAILTESPETPVIVVTGMNRVEDAVQALRQGAWNWIPRPVQDKDMLDGVVHRALERAALLKRCREYQEQLEKQNRDLQQSLNQLEADQKEGREVQSRLLPKKECKFGNYTVTQCLYPSMYLSGDFVDYFPIGDDHIGFYIADVSGHGAASAFVTVMLKTLIDQYREACVNGNDTTILAPEGPRHYR